MNEHLSTTLVKAQQIKDYVAGHPNGCSLKEISAAVALNKTTTYRLLKTLVTLGQVIKEARTYYLRESDTEARPCPVGWIASQIVQPLVNHYGLSAFLGMPFNHQLVITQVFATAAKLADYQRLGDQQAFNTSAMGKCALAFMNEHERNDLLQKTVWQAQTKNSLTDQQSLFYSLQLVREQGYALDDEEDRLNARCLAVPVFSGNHQLVAVLGILGSQETLQRRKIKQFIHDLQQVSKQLTNQLF